MVESYEVESEVPRLQRNMVHCMQWAQHYYSRKVYMHNTNAIAMIKDDTFGCWPRAKKHLGGMLSIFEKRRCYGMYGNWC